MDIERINDHTMKFFITYIDIEDRGFNREEIWYDRERSEELFWEMMDEARDHDDFFIDVARYGFKCKQSIKGLKYL